MRELSRNDLQWCLKRAPKCLLELLKERSGKVFVGGGFIRACIANETVNDIDLFVGDKDEAWGMAQFLMAKLAGKFTRLWKTDNAFTVHGAGVPIQIIHRWTYTTPEQLMKSFDFTIAMAGFWWEKTSEDVQFPNTQDAGTHLAKVGKWMSICDDRFYEDLAAKRLRYTSPVRNEDAGGSLLRVLKFYQKGYRIPLDSMGAVVARLQQGVIPGALHGAKGVTEEDRLARALTGLLREVDPNAPEDHIAYLPGMDDENQEENHD
jgi:hypothetical protein